MGFWKDKKVLITGASGFVGSNLTKRLIEENAKITVLIEHPIRKTSLLKLENLTGEIEKIQIGSVTDFSLLSNLIKRRKISTVFHLAAQPLVDVAQINPLSTFQINIQGTWNILEAARINKIEKVVIASTAHVYGDSANSPHSESQDPHPSRPYETSKAAADLLAQSYVDTYDLPVEIPRFTNIYGPGDFNLERIVPKLITMIISNKKPKIWDIGAVRDFLYIDDAIGAYLKIAETKLPNSKRHRATNFGSGKPISIKKLAETLIRISQKDLKIAKTSSPEERTREILKQYVTIDKAKKLFDWEPKVSIKNGIKITYLWYEKNISKFII